MSAAVTEDVRARMRSALDTGAPGPSSPELNDLLTDGCARMLALETQKLHLGRRISQLAPDAHEPEAASELRRLWVRRRTLAAEVRDLRALLRQLGGSRRSALASRPETTAQIFRPAPPFEAPYTYDAASPIRHPGIPIRNCVKSVS